VLFHGYNEIKPTIISTYLISDFYPRQPESVQRFWSSVAAELG